MRRALVVAGGTALLALAGCASTVVTPAASTGRVSDTQSSSPSASTGGSTDLATATTSTVPAASVPIAPPVTYSGTGSTTLAITKPAGTTAVVVTVKGNAPGHYLGVRALDGTQAHLVDADGPYSGSTLLDADGGTTTRLFVRAVVPWTITLSDPRSAPVFSTSYTGSGDTVMVCTGSAGTAAITAGTQGTRLRIRVYGPDKFMHSIVDTTGPYDNLERWPGGTSLVAVVATGQWSIAVN